MTFFEEAYQKFLGYFNFFDFNLIVYYLSITPAVLLIELLIVGWNKSSLKKLVQFKKTVKTDVIFYFIDVLNLYNLLTVIFSFGVFHILAKGVLLFTNFNLIATIDNIYLQFIVLFLISDLKSYFSHYIFHRYNSLWTLHEFHHSATEFCILTRHRGHFLEAAMKRMIDIIPFAILGSVETYVAVKILSEAHQLILHSSIKSSWGWLGKYVLVSPAAHRVHHSIEREHYGKNFGNTFIFWDRLFKTYYEADVKELGVEQNQYNIEGTFKDIIRSVKNFIASLRLSAERVLRKKTVSPKR